MTPPQPFGGESFFFQLEFPGAGNVRLSSFAGCFDKQLGVEYEDCYFSIRSLSQPVLDWLNDASQGINSRRDLTLVQVNFSGTIMSRIQIGNAFMRDFSVGDLDASISSTPIGSLSFVVVPRSTPASSESALTAQR